MICAAPNCSGAVRSRGYCIKHYSRLVRHGDPLGGGISRGLTLAWIEDHVRHQGDDCLIWPFARSSNGYAHIRTGGKAKSAARVMCAARHGQPPSPSHQAAHRCGNGHLGCVNPNHLRWATPSENNLEKADHGTAMRGEKSHRAKLHEAQVREIRALSGRLTQRELAAIYGVSQPHIGGIISGRTWGWLA